MVRQAVPLQPMEVNSGRDSHLQPMEAPMLKEAVTPWEAHAGAGSWLDLWVRNRQSSLFLKDYTPWKGHALEQLIKNCSLWEGLMFEKFMENCLPWQGPHNGAGEECEESSPLRRREQQRHMMD
ncbi:suppression of tumorigenicity 5 protein isoform x4 [Limosa lapponica baueri]|uniref:Suppression of tumorigenicity 5 protein isoform x4 n=1 Tax=Limosa lapponica baueri TaxID=1758121 RepID=A0A2I0U049_LIMLA|nr:suppression of tumorigenicity 5 protein isoform x4 [Limosa lapponica baueri]